MVGQMKIPALAFLVSSLAFAAHIEHVAGGGEASAGAPALQVKLVEPFAVDFGADGGWYICEHKGERIVLVDRSGTTKLLAGTGTPGHSGDGGPAAAATFRDPHGIAITREGTMYVADTLNHTIRRIDLKTGVVTAFAGTGEKGFSGDGGPASKATFNGTFAIALNPAQDRLYVVDLNNRRVRMIDLKSAAISTVAGNGESGVPADASEAAKAPLVDPRAVAVDSKDNVYILERRGNALRVVDKTGKIRTLIAPGSVSPDLNGPKHLCVDKRDDVIIADAENHLIRRYDPKTGKTTTIIGTGETGTRIDAANPLATQLNRPHGVAIDSSGALYVSDSYNHRILRVSGF
jgi:DNA-binding beta-propeller fold protein YncE